MNGIGVQEVMRMTASRGHLGRREFLAAAGAAGVVGTALFGAQDAPRPADIKLGFDNFSIRAFGWKAPQLIDYAASLGVDTLLMSDLGVYESLDDDYLAGVRERAEAKGLELHAGTGSVCSISSSYNRARLGPAEDHLRLLLRVAKAIGSPVARCYLGSRRDREGDGGIYRHIEEMIKVCKAVRAQAEESGVKIAIENHAGDMQAWELVELILAAGTDYVGATMDPGNAVWTMEDPMVNLELLGPHAVTAGIRDSAVWETAKGAAAMWANMGEGLTDWKAYLARYRELCSRTPFVLEIISYTWQSEMPYLEQAIWEQFPRALAREFARFVALAKRGRPYETPAGRPSGARSRELEQAQQKWDLEQSIAYCRNVLGLGVKR